VGVVVVVVVDGGRGGGVVLKKDERVWFLRLDFKIIIPQLLLGGDYMLFFHFILLDGDEEIFLYSGVFGR